MPHQNAQFFFLNIILMLIHITTATPFDETNLDAVRGLIELRGFHPSSSTSRARWRNAATFDKDKQICFMLMPRT